MKIGRGDDAKRGDAGLARDRRPARANEPGARTVAANLARRVSRVVELRDAKKYSRRNESEVGGVADAVGRMVTPAALVLWLRQVPINRPTRKRRCASHRRHHCFANVRRHGNLQRLASRQCPRGRLRLTHRRRVVSN